MNPYILVALGGAIGALIRFAIGRYLAALGAPAFISTLFVNTLGSFCIGLAFAVLVANRESSSELTPFVIVGILGGFTTFSAFSMELLQFIQTDRIAWAITYALVAIIIGIIACAFGFKLGTQI